MKKIVVLTGSPRRNGNSSRLADSFIKAAEEQGCEIQRFDTAFLKVAGCMACNACFSKGCACVVDDDFNKIAEAILEASAVIFVSPVYWYSFPAQLKAVIDKLYSFCVVNKDTGSKKCALLTCCEERDLDTFTGIKFSYEKTVALMHWNSIGEVLIPGVFEEGEIQTTNGEALAADLVNSL